MLLRGGRWRSVPIPALFALIEHPQLGPILFDTGYSPRFFSETRRWPYCLYAKITPVHLQAADTAACQLQRRGILPASIERIIISHFHADHVGGLADFPRAQFIYFADALRPLTGLAAVKAAFLPGLIPPDLPARSQALNPAKLAPLPPEYAPFTQGVDLLGDGTLLAVRLPGHAAGQLGVFLHAEGWGPVFLCADACWHSRAFRELVWPNPLVNLFLPNPRAYRHTLRSLHQLHRNRPDMRIIPSHCPEVAARYAL